MEKYLTKKEVGVILEKAPKGADGGKIIDGLVSRGYKLEGFNDQPEPAPTMTGSEKAPFQATGEENLLTGTAKAVGNLPRSTFELGKNVATAVVNPIDTTKSIFNITKGAGAKLGEKVLEDTNIGQSILQKMNESRVSRGLPALQTDESGKLQVADTPELQAVNQVGTFITDRYGSLDKFKETAIEDPAGVLADLATVISGGGAAISKVGNVSKIGEIAKVGETITKVGQAIEPISAITNTAGKVKNVATNSTVGKIASDIIPTVTELKKNQVVKALDLTQGDLATIGKKTGNDVTDFIVKNDLIKESPEAISEALNNFRKTAKETKASEISKVTNIYTPEQIPSVIKGLDTILADIDGVAGLEDVVNNIKTLKSKTQFTLEDVQNAQYLLDENSNIYSKIGDAKSSSKAKGLDKIRKDTRAFIENEVDAATGGQTNIRQINNDIQTAFSIEDAINTRATRNLTRQKISLSDSIVLFGGGATFSPIVGVGLYIGKKVIESPTFRLAFTKALSSQPAAKIRKIVSEIKNKTVSPETQKLLNQIADEAKKNMGVIESGATIVEQSKGKK